MPSLNSDAYLNPGWEHVWHIHRADGLRWIGRPSVFGMYTQIRARPGPVTAVRSIVVATCGMLRTAPSKARMSGSGIRTVPVDLVVMCLKFAGLAPEAMVLDPFAGIARTLVAARSWGDRRSGSNIDPTYCAAAEEQLRLAA